MIVRRVGTEGDCFSLVGPYDLEQRPDYLLTGRAMRLDEIGYGGRVRVEARLSAELTNMRTGVVVWTRSANQISNVDTRNVNSVVTEMNTAVQGASNGSSLACRNSSRAQGRQRVSRVPID